jgi:hypothetical protein
LDKEIEIAELNNQIQSDFIMFSRDKALLEIELVGKENDIINLQIAEKEQSQLNAILQLRI